MKVTLGYMLPIKNGPEISELSVKIYTPPDLDFDYIGGVDLGLMTHHGTVVSVAYGYNKNEVLAQLDSLIDNLAAIRQDFDENWVK